jgi:cytochrome c-type biogenesis protein CcmE
MSTTSLKPRQRRLLLAGVLVVAVGAIVALVANAFRSNLVFFYSPTQVVAQEAPVGRTFRLGGLVEPGSVKREGVRVNFVVTDSAKTVPVRYEGVLPDLFKEGKGVVAQGKLESGVFVAREVLAKHDENYMPPEAAEALKKAGAPHGSYAGQHSDKAAKTLVTGDSSAAGKPGGSGAAKP